MSLKALAWSWDRVDKLDDRLQLIVLLALADYCDEHNQCFPGYDTLMRKTLIKSATTLRKALANLELKGLITIQRRPVPYGGSTSNLYQLQLQTEYSFNGGSDSPETPSCKPETPSRDVPKLQGMDIPTSLNQSVKNQSVKEPKTTLEYPQALNTQAWFKWLEYKKSQFRFTYKSDSTLLTGSNKLIELADADYQLQQAIVDQSIA